MPKNKNRGKLKVSKGRIAKKRKLASWVKEVPPPNFRFLLR